MKTSKVKKVEMKISMRNMIDINKLNNGEKVMTEEPSEMTDKDLSERSTDFQKVHRMFLWKG